MARVACKAGVLPRSLALLCGVANVAATISWVAEVVITTGCNGVHKTGSKHYDNAALDIRIKNFPDAIAIAHFLAALRRELGERDYDFIIEDQGTPNQHIHIEYDPH